MSTRRRNLSALRLAAQHVGDRELSSPGEAVGWMLALQAQDFPGVKWSVGLRYAGATVGGVDAALDAGRIVRSWPLRGTLHVVGADDLSWLLALTAPRMIASTAARRAVLGLGDSDLERAREIAASVLAGGRSLTRAALLGSIDASGVSTAGQRGYHLLGYLAQTGTLVLGPTEGAQQSFVLLEEWVGHGRRLDRDEALGELAFRYFRSHGPATARDLARWSGLTLADVRRGVAACGGKLAAVELDGVTYELAPDTEAGQPGAADIHLLPGFDEYLLGYADRSAALAPEHAAAVIPGSNGVFKPTLLADGAVVGTWQRRISTHGVVVEAAPFEPLSVRDRDGLAQAAQRYGTFLGRPARLVGL